MTRRVWASLALAAALATSGLGCKHGAASASADDAAASPPFVVKDDTQGLLFTWIDEKGDFHVEQKASDVPLVGRDAVRVVDPTKEEGAHGDRIFVADLRVAGADGAYPVHAMTREEFDQLAVARRAKNAATLASAEKGEDAGAPSGDNAESANAGNAAAPDLAGRPAVIIYGAEWCGACKQAQAYLKKRGILFIEKDIEKDPGADAEMRAKLRRTGQHGGSIPVLDVRGNIMVGFSPEKVEEALGKPI
jgi:glutaredoxin